MCFNVFITETHFLFFESEFGNSLNTVSINAKDMNMNKSLTKNIKFNSYLLVRESRFWVINSLVLGSTKVCMGNLHKL